MSDVPAPHSIELFSGQYFDFDADAMELSKVVCIEDIAHALACVNRFTGQTRYPYSVAQHCLFVCERLRRLRRPLELRLAGLLHDAAEYVMNDTAKPLKLKLAPDERAELEIKVDTAIEMALGFPYDRPQWKAEIKAADTYAVLVEARELLPSRGKGWKAAESQKQWRLAGAQNIPQRIETPIYFQGELTWKRAEHEFLYTYHSLKEAIEWRST